MGPDFQKKIDRAKELLITSRHIALATVNEDGSPHNSPVRLMYSPNLEYLYWASHPEAQHSKNVSRTGQVFAVIYDRMERGGLYMKCSLGHELSGAELEEALKVHNDLRIKEGSEPLPLSYYENESPQRMYAAKIDALYANYSERGADGRLIKDGRMEIKAEGLLD